MSVEDRGMMGLVMWGRLMVVGIKGDKTRSKQDLVTYRLKWPCTGLVGT